MHSPNESDVEIKVFDEDGMALSAKSDLDDHEALDHHHHHHQSHCPLPTPSSDLYYVLHNEAPQTSLHQTPWTTSTHSKRRKIKHLIKNLCEAPHLYIQQRHSNASQSSWSTLVNYHQFIDEYLSFKYFYELSLPLCLELLLSFGCMAFSPICILIVLTLDCLIWRHVQLAVFALLVSLSSFATLHILAYFRLLPCRALPNVIHNTDEYGFNVTRTLNLRYWYYRNKERNTCSFPDYNTCNAMIYALSCYLFSAHWWPFILVAYVAFSRCYFAFNYLMDCVWSSLFALCVVGVFYYLLPQTFLVITEELVTEIAGNLFARNAV